MMGGGAVPVRGTLGLRLAIIRNWRFGGHRYTDDVIFKVLVAIHHDAVAVGPEDILYRRWSWMKRLG
ncbi:MAG: hypothetical protein CVV13_01355 [Gammaproteobacteria bacterium HGW-Gammaproteobacteria-3]|nr:MAG: hypothetical protein CVV13_01355 [Gammaproteobacteria bacterium HGW-Gammaproteobacteria-3]